jgi:hypothetical protein
LRDDVGVSGVVATHQTSLSKLVQRADHPAERQLGPTLTVHEAGTDDRDVLVTIEFVEQPVDGAR